MKTRITVSTLALLALVSACGRGGDSFEGAIPTADDLKIKVPEGEGQALAIGEESEMYQATYGISRFVNAHVGAVLVILHAITRTEPTVEEEDRRVWGPSEPQGLEKKSWRLTVERVAEGQFVYALESRDKGETDDEAFVPVWEGEAFPGEDTAGQGTIALRLDNDDDDCSTGTANVTYDLRAEEKIIDIAFDGVDNTCDADEAVVDTYHYREDAEGAGDFLFSLKGNIHKEDEDRPGLETLTIRSRWLSSGAGRADVVLASDEIAADLATHLPDSGAVDVRVTECWSDLFELTYTDSSPDELQDVLRAEAGDPTTCAIADADYPTVQ